MLYWLWVIEIPLCRLLFYLGFLSLAVTIDRAEGKGFEHLYTSLLLPTTHKHLDISWKFCNLDGYLVFLIAPYLINKLLLDNTSHTFIISITYCTAMIRFSTLALCGLILCLLVSIEPSEFCLHHGCLSSVSLRLRRV